MTKNKKDFFNNIGKWIKSNFENNKTQNKKSSIDKNDYKDQIIENSFSSSIFEDKMENKQNIQSNINLSIEDKFRNPLESISKEITDSFQGNIDSENNNDYNSNGGNNLDDYPKGSISE